MGLVVVAVAILAYFPVLFSETLINPDIQYVYPLLKSTGLSGYWQALLSFRTLDFQPVRDLTFFVDFALSDLLGRNTMVWQNLLWWIGCCLLVRKLLEELFPDKKRETIFLLVLAFTVYPLFTQTVAWGMGRKHLLAFFFILLATKVWVKNEKPYLAIPFYALSILSQPITILWPLWAALHTYFFRREALVRALKVLVPLGLLLILVAIVNKLYYAQSPVFLSNSANVTNQLIDPADCILALGHYAFQLFFPYLLSFKYHLGHWSFFVGMGALGLLALALRTLKVELKWAASWSLFGALPLCMVMMNPRVQYDTYLLVPALALLILLLKMIRPSKNLSYGLSGLVLVWTGLSAWEARGWTDELLMVRRSFERRPSCQSAGQYLRISYENEVPTEREVRQYLYNSDCGELDYSGKERILLQAYMLFYETDLPLEERLANLKRLAELEFFPHLILAAFYVRENRSSEASEVLDQIKAKWGRARFRKEYAPIVAKYLYPYCTQIRDEECLHIVDPFVHKAEAISYK